MTITLEQLEQFCRDYDARWGQYPESEFEGWSLYHYIQARLRGETGDDAPFAQRPDDWHPSAVLK